MFLTCLPTTYWVNQISLHTHGCKMHKFLCRCLRFTDTAEMFMSLFASRSSLEKLGLWSIRSKGGNKVHRWGRSSDFLKDVQFRHFGLFHLLSLDLYPVHQKKVVCLWHRCTQIPHGSFRGAFIFFYTSDFLVYVGLYIVSDWINPLRFSEYKSNMFGFPNLLTHGPLESENSSWQLHHLHQKLMFPFRWTLPSPF